MKDKVSLAILTNDLKNDHLKWVNAINRNPDFYEYKIINIFKHDWFEKLNTGSFDFILAKPPGLKSILKQIYDERLELLPSNIKEKLYPSLFEIKIYENKRYFYQWLKTQNIPHPSSWITADKEDAIELSGKLNFPVVAKTSIGASGSGVKIIRNKLEYLKYVDRSFSISGAPKRVGPNFAVGSFYQKLKRLFSNSELALDKIQLYAQSYYEKQRDFVILQEYIEHDYEWRVVIIGDSYFAHKKLKKGEKASGSLLKIYDNPPDYIFDFAHSIINRYGFYSQAIDLFETKQGRLLVNEMQCIFGQSDPYQMLFDNKPGRMIKVNGKWVFEEGDFAKNECYDLRLEHILKFCTSSKDECSYRFKW